MNPRTRRPYGPPQRPASGTLVLAARVPASLAEEVRAEAARRGLNGAGGLVREALEAHRTTTTTEATDAT